MNGVVICELGERQKRNPVVLVVVQVVAKELFENLIDTLGLAIALGVKGSGKSRRDAQVVAEDVPKTRSELWSTVRYDRLRESVMFEDMLQKDGGCVVGGNGAIAGNKVCHLGEAVDPYGDCVVTLRRR